MSKKQFAVFDIDGTLIRWQLYHAIVDGLARKQMLDPGLQEQIRQARMAWKRREHTESFRDYELEIIKAYEAALPRLSAHEFDTTVEEIAHEYKEQTYTFTRNLASDLKKRGYVLLAISGSHQELVEHVGRQYGFDDCVGTQYKRDDDRFTGEKFFAAADKQAVLEKLIKKHNLSVSDSYAVGDSKSDAPMLSMVENPIAFNPDRQLLDTARKKRWRIVVERKNVVYDLRSEANQYILL